MRRRSIPSMVKKYAEEWREWHVHGKQGGTATVQEIVRRHLDNVFAGALNAMLGVRVTSFHEVEFVRKDKDQPETIIETILNKYRDEMTSQFIELLKLKEFAFKPDELRRLRRRYREALMEKLDEAVQSKASEVSEIIVEHELRHLWMDDETVALVEGKLEEEKG